MPIGETEEFRINDESMKLHTIPINDKSSQDSTQNGRSEENPKRLEEQTFSSQEAEVLKMNAVRITKLADISFILPVSGSISVTNYRIKFVSPICCSCVKPKVGFHGEGCRLSLFLQKISPLSWNVAKFNPVHDFQFQIPVYSVKKLEVINSQEVRFVTKNCQVFNIRFKSRQECIGFFNMVKIQCFKPLKECVALSFSVPRIKKPESEFSLEKEYIRLNMNDHPRLQLISQTNAFEFCKTYPKMLMVAKNVNVNELKRSAEFRSKRRFPVATWVHPKNGAIISRSSQPLVGLGNARNPEDEKNLVSLLLEEGYYGYQNGFFEAETDAFSNLERTPSFSNEKGAQISSSMDPGAMLSRENSTSSTGDVVDGVSQMFTGLMSKINRGLNGKLAVKSSAAYTNQTFDQKLQSINKRMKGPKTEPQQAGSKSSFYIIDARSQLATYGNKAFGRGTENINNYFGAKLLFMSLDNIHTLRKSYEELGRICQPEFETETFYRNVEDCGWVRQVRSIISSAVQVAEIVDNLGSSVLIHCSDGWDRTSQISSLVQLLLDPFYRSRHGFMVLVQKEWFSFGHKFRDRCGFSYPKHSSSAQSSMTSVSISAADQVSPVFMAWLDAIWQISQQFGTGFEFNEEFLLFLSHAAFAGRFCNFFCNSDKERIEINLKEKGDSVWLPLLKEDRFKNKDYSSVEMSLIPSVNGKYMRLWEKNYFPTSSNDGLCP